jgi:hypothetical protein
MFIPDQNFFHPGSRFKKIPGSRIRILIKEFKYFNQNKLFLCSGKFYPAYSSRIWILIFTRIPGFKKAPDPGSGSATLLSTIVYGKKDAFRRIKIDI